MRNWLPGTTLPTSSGRYLVFIDGHFRIGTWTEETELSDAYWSDYDTITGVDYPTSDSPDYWMPLPAPPEHK